MILPRSFYIRPVQIVARDLLGMELVRIINQEIKGGIIIETEAYDGEQDLACHARSGKTSRNRMMYGKAGNAYVYFTYGMHWMLNCVTGEEGYPAAVLIRSILPVFGRDLIEENRKGIDESQWCNGPAKLSRALDVTGELNGIDLCNPESPLTIKRGKKISNSQIKITPRIGIQNTPEPWRSKPWRFLVDSPQINY